VIARDGPPAGAAGGPRYLLRPSVEPFVDRHGVLCFVIPGGQDLVVQDPDPVDVELVRRLEGSSATAEALASSVGAHNSLVRQKLDSLVAAGLVLVQDAEPGPSLPGEDAERFSRQLPYLAELGDALQLQRRLRDSCAAVIGCGGLGTWAIAALACIGVGRLVIVDDDAVDLSNLNRQILYTRRDVGTAKVTASASWLREFDPAIEVTTIEHRIAAAADVEPAIAGADVVVLAADSPPYEIARWVNAACAEARVPFIVAGQLPPVLKIGPMYAPGSGACFSCHETALAKASSAYEDYVAHRMCEPATSSTLGPASSVVGGLIGLELLHLLAGDRPATQDAAFLVNLRTLEVRREPVARDPSCATCKHLE
jgi:bacteriocin biosynthesis cyclodehydratase domain-containing protein